MAVAICVVLIAWAFHVSASEWIVLLACIASVLSLEMINSSIEKICNLVHPTYHPAIKTIKDMAAAAVLFVSIITAIIGAIIFIPKILPML